MAIIERWHQGVEFMMTAVRESQKDERAQRPVDVAAHTVDDRPFKVYNLKPFASTDFNA